MTHTDLHQVPGQYHDGARQVAGHGMPRVPSAVAGVGQAGSRSARRSRGWDSLTAREQSVVRLASYGMTNRQIGAELFASHRTVSAHLYHVFRKLEVSSRVELTRYVVERGLADESERVA
jgi:DNA-binding CsgD family transcriptional regulator